MDAAEAKAETSSLHERIAACHPQVLKWCRFWYRNYPDGLDRAEDAAQDAILRALRLCSSYRAESALATWLYQVTRSTLLDRHRAWKSRMKHGLVSLDEAPESDLVQEFTFPDHLEIRHLRQQFHQVDSTMQDVLLMRGLGYSYKEMGTRLSLNLGTVKSRMHRARRRLSDQTGQTGGQMPLTANFLSQPSPSRKVLVVTSENVDHAIKGSYGHRSHFFLYHDLSADVIPFDVSSVLVFMPKISDLEKVDLSRTINGAVKTEGIRFVQNLTDFRTSLAAMVGDLDKNGFHAPTKQPASQALPPRADIPPDRKSFIAAHVNLRAQNRGDETRRIMSLPGADKFPGSYGAWYQAVNMYFNRSIWAARQPAGQETEAKPQSNMDEEDAIGLRAANFRDLTRAVSRDLAGQLETLTGIADKIHKDMAALRQENRKLAEENARLKGQVQELDRLRRALETARQALEVK